MRPVALLLPLVAACAGGPSTGPDPVAPDRAVPVARALSAGSVVRLLPCEVRGAPSVHADVVDGLLREALRQSEWLDIAAGPVAAPPVGPAIEVTVDGTDTGGFTGRDDGTPGGTATAFLLDGEQRRHLATALLAGRALPDVLDELAVHVRQALGDPATATPLPVARIYSADAQVIAGCEAAIALVHDGRFADAMRRLETVRRRDGGAALVLETMASLASVSGDAERARDLAQEALALTARLGPTTTHRLLRTLLLAQASLQPSLAHRFDQELWRLAEVADRERPHDPEVRYTAGIALNFLGRFADAQAVLTQLTQRLPDHAGAAYHLGWAALGNGDPDVARAAFERAAVALPQNATVVPLAMSRYEAGDHDELRAWLADLAGEPAVRGSTAFHEVLRMQAAHELLCGDAAAAVECMFEDIAWLLAHPRVLELRSAELADTAETLVRLGHGARLRPLLTQVLDRWPQTMVADAASYALGLVDASARDDRRPSVEDGLLRRGRTFWGESLAAFGHHRRGELAAEQQALGRAAQQSSNPLLKAALVANLRALGRTAEAEQLRATLREEMTRIDLRRRSQHPLLGPELAFAWLAP
ncbi:MAG: tetratricopeptide repeat protein [Planctomycetota bacterium]